MKKILIHGAVIASSLFMFAGIASAATGYTLYGNAMVVASGGNPGQYVQATSDMSTSTAWGGINFSVPAGTTFNSLTSLSTDFKVITGDCGGGAPRFSITLSSGKNVFVYLGPTPNFTGCNAAWQATGNVVGTTTLRVDTSKVGGSFYDNWSHAQSLVGSQTITNISLDVDGGWSIAGKVQSIGFDNTDINGTVYTYEPPTYTVTIDKYLDGHMATAPSAQSMAFPMVSSWSAVNLGGAGSGSYTLSTTGFNSPNSYEAITSAMNQGSSYTTSEVTTGNSIVGASCGHKVATRLAGYTWGSTLSAAASMHISKTAPNFSNLTQNEVVIVWNESCPASKITVTNENKGTVTVMTTSSSNSGDNAIVGSSNGKKGGGGGDATIVTGDSGSNSSSFVIMNTNFADIEGF